VATWCCVKQCGACCNLNPADRPELDQYLSPEDLEYYLSLVGEDGWCIHYDNQNRDCKIYSDRPWFCRVQIETFQQMFDIEPEELNDFAIECCQQQIDGVYGNQSVEMQRFNQAVGITEGEE
jgi:Fe-S-cluster containining protein